LTLKRSWLRRSLQSAPVGILSIAGAQLGKAGYRLELDSLPFRDVLLSRP
jgi:hypothetical protein